VPSLSWVTPSTVIVPAGRRGEAGATGATAIVFWGKGGERREKGGGLARWRLIKNEL
jgi:hypothetical protein